MAVIWLTRPVFLAVKLWRCGRGCGRISAPTPGLLKRNLPAARSGHLDLIIPIRGDMEEGFQVFGEHGSAQGRVFLPWFHKSSVVECFSNRDRMYRRPLGEDAYTYKLQIEGFADTILNGAPQHGADVDDGAAAMRAMVAMARSVETGEKLRLAEMTGTV